jgi:hypothetical protein
MHGNSVIISYTIDVWIELQERFFKVDRIRAPSLCSSINNLKQGEKYVLHYILEMKSLWEELNSHRSMPHWFEYVNYACTVVFSPHFHLSHILYAPSFKVNLISVSKMCQSLYYKVNFLPVKCVIQDVKTQKMIGLGNLCDAPL